MPLEAKGIGSPGAGVRDSCELSEMSVRNLTLVFFKNNVLSWERNCCIQLTAFSLLKLFRLELDSWGLLCYLWYEIIYVKGPLEDRHF